jgi:hypothetical protein
MSIRARSLLLYVRRTDATIGPLSITPAEFSLTPPFSPSFQSHQNVLPFVSSVKMNQMKVETGKKFKF